MSCVVVGTGDEPLPLARFLVSPAEVPTGTNRRGATAKDRVVLELVVSRRLLLLPLSLLSPVKQQARASAEACAAHPNRSAAVVCSARTENRRVVLGERVGRGEQAGEGVRAVAGRCLGRRGRVVGVV